MTPPTASGSIAESTDKDDMLSKVLDLPEQLAHARTRYQAWNSPALAGAVDRIYHVVVAGMGGSAIGGDLLAHLWSDALRLPVHVVRGPALPGWVGETTLFIGSSFSGNTEETLAAFEAAGLRGATRVAITSGGRLETLASTADCPVVRLEPGGQPRAALGQSLAALIRVAEVAQVVTSSGDRLTAAIDGMRSLADRYLGGASLQPWADAPSVAETARFLHERVPVIYAPSAVGPVARRWKTQLNENAKSTAFWEELPELDHNAIVGYPLPATLPRCLAVVSLEPASALEGMTTRLSATLDLVAEAELPHIRIRPPVGPIVAEGLWLALYGDLVSVALAELYGVDPTPVEAIGRLKARLERS